MRGDHARRCYNGSGEIGAVNAAIKPLKRLPGRTRNEA